MSASVHQQIIMGPFLLCLLVLTPLFSTSHGSCVPEAITDKDDAAFCSDDLQIEFPEIGNVACMKIPLCNDYTYKVMKNFGQPAIKYSKAEKDNIYVVMIVDPDATSRSNPTYKNWRHFLATDIQNQDLKTGIFESGHILTDYRPPGPPKGTGFHRYQVLVYLQPTGNVPHLLPEEASLGRWDPDAFAARNGLIGPVATSQFMVQNPQ
ncbi:phosphatidylethanolamine-binding protein 4 [Gastrophryne carolinensis]